MFFSFRITRTSNAAAQRRTFTTRRIAFLTDVEGDRDYLTRFVAMSKVLCFDNNEQHIKFQNDHDMFVFGGDTWDQGGSDLYCIRQLLRFKETYPDRVHFVMGNRDMNKMRVVSELKGQQPHKGVYWLKGSGLPGDPELNNVPMNPVERLKWMLRYTMGSPRAFEYRKWELNTSNDMDVVESYRNSCHPDGEMGRYLAQANLVLRIGDVLFMHGALPMTNQILEDRLSPQHVWDDLSFAMPWKESNTTSVTTTIDEWLVALNEFAQMRVKDFQKQDYTGIWSETGGYNQSYGALVQYGMGWTPDRIRNPTVVYASWSSDGMPRRFFRHHAVSPLDSHFVNTTKEFFLRSGVSLICSGHQPQGDMPNSIRLDLEDENRSAWIFSCDTSYSGDTIWHQPATDPRSNRGRGAAKSGRGEVAVSEVLIEQCTKTLKAKSAYWHGVLSDGTAYETKPFTFGLAEQRVGEMADGSERPEESPHEQEGHWWKRAVFQDGSTMLTAGKGFDFYNRLIRT